GVELLERLRDHHAGLIVPGAGADAVARVDRVRAEVGAPGLVARADGRRQPLTGGVCPVEAAQVSAVLAAAFAGDEEAHRRVVRVAGLVGAGGHLQRVIVVVTRTAGESQEQRAPGDQERSNHGVSPNGLGVESSAAPASRSRRRGAPEWPPLTRSRAPASIQIATESYTSPTL